MRRPDGVTVIAIYHFISALPLLIGACAILGVPISGALSDADRTGTFWALFGLGLGFLFTLGFGLASVVAGWGLLAMKNWARWLAIVLAALAVIGSMLTIIFFPVFVIISGVIIWYLLQARVREAFEAAQAPADESQMEEAGVEEA